MAVAFQATGTAVDSVATTLVLVAPATNAGDIILLNMVTADNAVVGMPDGSWNVIQAVNNTAAMRSTTAWHRASDSDSGASFTFTVAGVTVAYGVLSTYRGAKITGSPVGTSSNSPNSSSATITYATITPNSKNSLIVALAQYAAAGTTTTGIGGSNPTFTNRYDNNDGVNAVFALYGDDGLSGNSAATGSRTQASGTGAALNTGVLIELLEPSNENILGEGGLAASTVAWPNITRTRPRGWYWN